jgi:hypothetical protein
MLRFVKCTAPTGADWCPADVPHGHFVRGERSAPWKPVATTKSLALETLANVERTWRKGRERYGDRTANVAQLQQDIVSVELPA